MALPSMKQSPYISAGGNASVCSRRRDERLNTKLLRHSIDTWEWCHHAEGVSHPPFPTHLHYLTHAHTEWCERSCWWSVPSTGRAGVWADGYGSWLTGWGWWCQLQWKQADATEPTTVHTGRPLHISSAIKLLSSHCHSLIFMLSVPKGLFPIYLRFLESILSYMVI